MVECGHFAVSIECPYCQFGTGKIHRRSGMIVMPYDIPRGYLGAYYPEANVLIPIGHHAEQSHVPAAKSVPVRITPDLME